MNVVEANRKRELWLLDNGNVYFIPQGWCDAWSVAKGDAGGLDYIDDTDGPRPEIYCYAPTHKYPNSPIDTLFVPITMLENLQEIDEETARLLHPELADYLDNINNS